MQMAPPLTGSAHPPGAGTHVPSKTHEPSRLPPVSGSDRLGSRILGHRCAPPIFGATPGSSRCQVSCILGIYGGDTMGVNGQSVEGSGSRHGPGCQAHGSAGGMLPGRLDRQRRNPPRSRHALLRHRWLQTPVASASMWRPGILTRTAVRTRPCLRPGRARTCRAARDR